MIFLEISVTLSDPRIILLGTLSLNVTPEVPLSVLISLTSILLSSLFVVAQVSGVYVIAGIITLVYNFFFNLLSVKLLEHLFQLAHPA